MILASVNESDASVDRLRPKRPAAMLDNDGTGRTRPGRRGNAKIRDSAGRMLFTGARQSM